MTQQASGANAASARLPPQRPFLVTDVGGTHARIALVRQDTHGAIEILEHHDYRCSDYPGLAPIIAEFLAAPGQPKVDDIAIGCAGILQDEAVISSNLPWPVSLPDLRGLGIARLAVVNDFVAVAHAAQCMTAENSSLLTPDARSAGPGPVLVVGPGTGLGAAIRVPHGDRIVVLPSEAGHLSFAPGNAREIEVLTWLLQQTPHVSNEHLVSGPGLLRLYQVLCALDGVQARQHAPADIPAAARRGDDVQAAEAARMFCGMFGSVVADVVMVSGAVTAFIAGGIVPKIKDFLGDDTFNARFLNKGVMRQVLERVPVYLFENPHTGLIGAASWYLEQRRDA